MTDNKTTFKAWMPIQKQPDGSFIGILSDTSLDRDEEFMTKELLGSWAKDTKALPMLANHENRMEKFIGGWKNKKLIGEMDKYALTAEPFFFTKEANPLAAQIKKQVEEAMDNGLNVGISISAIVHKTISKEIDGVSRTGFAEAEIIEATVVPVQSNRSAAFEAVAKTFKTNTGGQTMTELTQKDIDLAVEKKEGEFTDKVANFEKQLGEKDSEIANLKKEVEDSDKAKEEAEEAVSDAEEKAEEAEKEADKANKVSLEKQNIADTEVQKGKELVEKEVKEGKLPILRMER